MATQYHERTGQRADRSEAKKAAVVIHWKSYSIVPRLHVVVPVRYVVTSTVETRGDCNEEGTINQNGKRSHGIFL